MHYPNEYLYNFYLFKAMNALYLRTILKKNIYSSLFYSRKTLGKKM